MSRSTKYNRIMVVDDDADVAMWEIVAQSNPETLILISTGGLSALRHLDQFDYKVDAIVSDLSMPDMDGVTLTRLIRRNEEIRSIEEIPIFWLTGYPINDIIRGLQVKYKVVSIFTKPSDPTEMIALVKAYISDDQAAHV